MAKKFRTTLRYSYTAVLQLTFTIIDLVSARPMEEGLQLHIHVKFRLHLHNILGTGVKHQESWLTNNLYSYTKEKDLAVSV